MLVVAAGMAAASVVQADVSVTPTYRWIVDTHPAAAVAVDDVLYLGGEFQYIGRATDTGQSFLSLDTGTVWRRSDQRPSVALGPPFMATIVQGGGGHCAGAVTAPVVLGLVAGPHTSGLTVLSS